MWKTIKRTCMSEYRLFFLLFSSLWLLQPPRLHAQREDVVKNQLMSKVLRPYFTHLNDLLATPSPEPEKTPQYDAFKALFSDPRIEIAQDFVKGESSNLGAIMPIGTYVRSLREHWKQSGAMFRPPEAGGYYFALDGDHYLVLFKKTIIGDIEIDGETLDDYQSSPYIEMLVNKNYKITIIRRASGIAADEYPEDKDRDGIFDTYEEKKYDDCQNPPNTVGLISLRGCPDGDGDGVIDDKDECPYSKQDACGKRGCPDRDCDGVLDKDDDCPDTAGVKSKHGCKKLPKPYRLALGLIYGPTIPLGTFADFDPLTGTNYDWTKKVGFAQTDWNPLHYAFGLSLDYTPARWRHK